MEFSRQENALKIAFLDNSSGSMLKSREYVMEHDVPSMITK